MILSKLIRYYHLIDLPWRFDDQLLLPQSPVPKEIEVLLENLLTSFQQSYVSLVSSLANKDIKFIKTYTTPELYKSIEESFSLIHEKNHTLAVINQDSIGDINVQFFNEKLKLILPERFRYIGDDITNRANMFKSQGWAPNTEKPLNLFFEKGDNIELIFEVSVLITSPYKLLMHDENKNIIKGSSSVLPESHLIDFQSTIEIGIFNFIRFFNSVFKNKYQIKPSDLENGDWIISDIGNYLKEKK